MTSRSRFVTFWSVLALFLAVRFAAAQEPPIVLKASTLLDGKGKVLHNTIIVVAGGKIARVGGNVPKSALTYDLTRLTVLPGWIDVHVHPTWHFDANGRLAGVPPGPTGENEPKQQTALAGAANSWKMLAAGFTTVQSLGSPLDKDLKDAIDRQGLPGPRILTSLEPIFGRGDATGTPDELRAIVQQHAKDGADVIKVFASGSIREGGKPTLSQEQLDAICGEAKKAGLRTVVHAYGPSVRMASQAGCTEIEHGLYATEGDLGFLAEHGTYFDPQAGLVIQNYLDNKARYLGFGNYTETAFETMRKVLPEFQQLFRQAITTRGLKVIFGTDAVAGAHGRNAEEFIYRVQTCGQEPMDAMVSANSLAAEALGLQNRTGSIAPGLDADIIALDGDPLKDITVVRHVVFVMRGGRIFVNQVTGQAK
ncbi:MAG: amidohydrolase [Acidobacteria bacterium]|nr:MAG: amidohydrolase [Acidobacteriota bacterium]